MEGDQPAADVFGLLADGTRVDILRAIADAQREQEEAGSGPAELGFSEIYNRTSVDTTSQLSYHLGELSGTFLRKTDDGYSFTHAGERMVRFILSEGYEQPTDFGAEPVSGTCIFCGETTLEASLHHQFLYVRCTSCEKAVTGYPITPAQSRASDGETLIRRVKQTQAVEYKKIRRGVCPECSGELSTEVRDMEESPLPDADQFLAIDHCEECFRRYSSPLSCRVAYHPASVAFHWDHGIDVNAQGVWDFFEHVRDGRWTSERISTDPVEYLVVLRLGEDVLELRLDSSATITSSKRVRRRTVRGDRS